MAGKEYVSTKGTVIEGRHIGGDCRCKQRCFEEINEEARMKIFEVYYSLKDDTAHDSFLFSCMKRTQPARRRVRDDDQQSRRSCSISYFIKVNGEDRSICKVAFCNILGISRHKVEYLQGKMKNGKVTPGRSGRGKHDSRPNKTQEDTLTMVRNHITSIPKYMSHYSRHENPNRRYLSPELNISRLYVSYKQQCLEEGKTFVKEWKYRQVFNEEFNLAFGYPRSDTCKTCDGFKFKIAASQDDNEKAKMMAEWDIHKRHSEKAFTSLREDRDLAKQDGSDTRVISFDLQQALPTPHITTGIAFYKRQLWTYNTGIHDCNTEKGYMCVWSENVAGRGASEIGSCLLRFFDSVQITEKHLITYSDSCGGQNKNRHIVALWWYLIKQGKFD